MLFFFQVHTAKTNSIKIKKLFFAYRIGNNLYSREQSLDPQIPSPVLKGWVQCFPSLCPCCPVRGAAARTGVAGAVGTQASSHCFPGFISCFPCHWLVSFMKQLVIECLTKKCLQAVFLVHNCLAEGNNNLDLNFSPPLSLSYQRWWQCCLCLKRKMG